MTELSVGEEVGVRRRAPRNLGWGLRAWVAAVTVILVGPTLVVIPMSLTASHTFRFPPTDWSLRWYRVFFTSDEWLSSLLTSVEVAILAAVFSTILGVAAAFGLNRSNLRALGLVRAALMAPMIVPVVVIAIALYATFLEWHLVGTLTGFVIAHTIFTIPFVLVAVTASLDGYDKTVERASASLGARPLTTFRRIVLPLIMPGVRSGFVFAFVVSLDEVVIALFLQSPSVRTLPVQMFLGITTQINPTVAAASTIVVLATTVVLVVPLFSYRHRS